MLSCRDTRERLFKPKRDLVTYFGCLHPAVAEDARLTSLSDDTKICVGQFDKSSVAYYWKYYN